MRAIRYTAVDTAEYAAIEVPVPSDGEVRLQPLFTGICGTDSLVIAGRHSRATPPVTLGHEFSALAIDPDPDHRFDKGDLVTVEPIISCETCNSCLSGLYNRCEHMQLFGIDLNGSLAELVCVPAGRVHKMPDNTTPEEAALVEPLAVAIHLVRQGKTGPAKTDFFVFGGGPIGMLTALVLKAQGGRVAIAELNPARQEIARKHGFLVIKTPENIETELSAAFGTNRVSSAYEATGTSIGLQTCMNVIDAGGTIGCVGLPKQMLQADITTLIGREAKIYGSRIYTSIDFESAIELIGSGQIDLTDFTNSKVSFESAVDSGFAKVRDGVSDLKILIEAPRSYR